MSFRPEKVATPFTALTVSSELLLESTLPELDTVTVELRFATVLLLWSWMVMIG